MQVQISQDVCEFYQFHSLSYSETAHFILHFGPAKTRKLQKCVWSVLFTFRMNLFPLIANDFLQFLVPLLIMDCY